MSDADVGPTLEDAKPARNWAPLIALSVIYLILCAAYATLALAKHARFETAAFDLGIFDQAIFRWSHFLSPVNTIRRVPSIFADHFHPALMLLVPLRWLGGDERALLVAQPFIAGAGAFPIFFFARRRIPEWSSVAFAIAFLVSWPFADAMAFDFHEVAFTALALPLAICAFDRKHDAWMWLAILFLLLTKEDQGLAVAGLGVVALIRKQVWLGCGLIALGVGWLLVMLKVVIPHFYGAEYSHWLYYRLGATPLALVIGAITNPNRFLLTLVQPAAKAKVLLRSLGTYALLPFGSIYGALIPLPLLTILLVDHTDVWRGGFHYYLALGSIWAISATDGLANAAKLGAGKQSEAVFRKRIAIGTIVALLAVAITSRGNELRRLSNPQLWTSNAVGEDGARIIALIPPDASVSATNNGLGHLSGRKWAYQLRYGYTYGRGYPAVRARYVLIDPMAFNSADRRKDCHPFDDPDYELVKQLGDWYLFKLVSQLPDSRRFYRMREEGRFEDAKMFFDQSTIY